MRSTLKWSAIDSLAAPDIYLGAFHPARHPIVLLIQRVLPAGSRRRQLYIIIYIALVYRVKRMVFFFFFCFVYFFVVCRPTVSLQILYSMYFYLPYYYCYYILVPIYTSTYRTIYCSKLYNYTKNYITKCIGYKSYEFTTH